MDQQVPSTIQGSEVVYQCNAGYVPTTKHTSVCTGSGEWDWDPNEIQCKGQFSNQIDMFLCPSVHAAISHVLCNPAADCGDPASPRNSHIMPYEITSEGAIIHYGCNNGFVPEGLQLAVCTSAGTWEPNPESLDCKIPRKYVRQLSVLYTLCQLQLTENQFCN